MWCPTKPPSPGIYYAVKLVCHKLDHQKVDELRADIYRVLKSSHPSKPNLTKSELQALSQLKKDRTSIALTAEMGVALVVIDRKMYVEKATNLLSQPMYRTIAKNPTNRLKAKLITLFRQLKRDTSLEEYIYKYMYPTGCSSSKLMVYLKSTKLIPPFDL